MKDFKNYLRLYPSLFNFNFIKYFLSYPLRNFTYFPYSINFLITDKCNFHCKMCSYFAKDPDSKGEKLNFDEIKNFITSIKKFKPVIAFGGGEPFMRKDFLKILNLIKEDCKLKCVVLTNGYLLNEGIIKKLAKLKLDYIIISLYGDREITNSITGISDSYDKILENIKLILREKTINLILSIVLLEENFKILGEMIDNLLRLGIKKIKIENLNYITKKEYYSTNWRRDGFNLTPFTLIKEKTFEASMVKEMMKIFERINENYNHKVFFKPLLSEEEFVSWYGNQFLNVNEKRKCLFLRHSLFIDPYGNIIPCQFLRACIMGNIKKDDIRKIWDSSRYSHLRKTIDEINLPLCFRCCK